MSANHPATSRWKAAAVHAVATLVVATAVGALLFVLWYPPPFFGAGGANRLMLLLLGINLVIGPLLTLVVFRSGKWGLRFDLTVIALLQVAALAYGLYVIARTRPVFLVASIDRFVMVSSDAIDDADLAKGTLPEYRSRSWTGPRLVGARIPDAKARERLVEAAMRGRDIENFPEYYVPYSDVVPVLLGHARPVSALRQEPLAAAKVEAWLARHDRSAASIVWVPTVDRSHDVATLLDARTGALLDSLDIDPWASDSERRVK